MSAEGLPGCPPTTRRVCTSETYPTRACSVQLIWSQLPITYVMLYGPSAGELRKNGETDVKYPSRADGSDVALSVRSSGAWKPRCESGADATAACQSFTFTSVKPWPGPVIFQPNMPIGSYIFANAIAVASGESVGGALNATESSLVTRTILPYWESCFATADEIWSGPPNR